MTSWFVFPAVELELEAAGMFLIDFPCAFLAKSFLLSTAIEVALEIGVIFFGSTSLLLFELS